MHDYDLDHPDATREQRYKVYEDSYYERANSHIFRRFFKPSTIDQLIAKRK